MVVENKGQELKIWKDMEKDASLKYHLGRLTKDELKNIVKSYEIKGVSKLKKDELIEIIFNNIVEKANEMVNVEGSNYKELLTAVSKEGNFKNYTEDLNLDDIIALRNQGIIFTGTIEKQETIVLPEEVKNAITLEESNEKEDRSITAKEIAKLTKQIKEIEILENKRKLNNFEDRNTTPIVKGKKVGRNELCPCGSGKKYKKCCLGKTNN